MIGERSVDMDVVVDLFQFLIIFTEESVKTSRTGPGLSNVLRAPFPLEFCLDSYSVYVCIYFYVLNQGTEFLQQQFSSVYEKKFVFKDLNIHVVPRKHIFKIF